MLITKMALPRRTFLRGVGAAVALPFLDAMMPALSAQAKKAPTVRRLGFVYTPNGATMASWTPKGDGPALDELSPTLSALNPLKDHVLVPTGLSQRQAESWGNGNGEIRAGRQSG